MAIGKDLVDQRLAGRDLQGLSARNGLVDELKKALSERLPNTGLDERLVRDAGRSVGNHRHGKSRKSMLTGTSKVTLDIPRDWNGTFDPKPIAKDRRRFSGFDDKVISMYARGMSVRGIRMHPEEISGTDVSPDPVSSVTNAVLEEGAEWHARPPATCHPLVFFDAIRGKNRDEGFVRNKAVYVALGILPDGTGEILGLWIERTGGVKFRLRGMNESKARGPGAISIAAVDGSKGFPEAIDAVFPDAVVQTCIVHPIRHSMTLPPRRTARLSPGRSGPSSGRRTPTRPLDVFEEGPRGAEFPATGPAWRRNWHMVIPFFAFPESVRRIIHTTNAIEALDSKLRRAVRARGHFPNDDAAAKLPYPVFDCAAQDRKRPPREWTEARTQFAAMFGKRFANQ